MICPNDILKATLFPGFIVQGFRGYAMLAISLVLAPAYAVDGVSRYEQIRSQAWHEAQGKRMGVFVEDVNVWVYSDRFRKRFRMPDAWKSRKLNGTEALAWRTEPTGHLVCDEENKERRCLPVHECVMETFLPPKQAGKLALEDRSALRPWKSSARMLLERNPEFARYAEASIRLPKAKWQDAEFPVQVLRYDRSVRSGEFTNVVLMTDCRLGKSSVTSPSVLTLSAYEEGGRIDIDIPNSFWQRVLAYMDEKRQHQRIRAVEGTSNDNSLWLYTPDFARRFDLPRNRVSDKLEGLEAVAFRVEPEGFSQCGYFGDPENCNYAVGCKFDLYLRSGTPVVYTSEQRMQHRLISDAWRALPRWKYERRENDEGKHINSMLDMAGINWAFVQRQRNKYRTGMAHADRYWRKNVLLSGYHVMTLGRTCPVSLPKVTGENYIIFGSQRLAPADKWAFRDDTGVAHRAKYPDKFFESLSHKAIHDKECVYKSSMEDVVLDHYKGNDRRVDENSLCSERGARWSVESLVGALKRLFRW